ncbi:putative tubulin polyglutamylase complex subunit 1 isoform X2 [Apostichopus japonicus]|uniref:Putative tubulin polyglutamylase complex subunit 1 isoform X2 n=1 Tax=Stichopus japonicus TaxID=307972 RepID=A0A2G8LC80_STIJA|nr:putative tubulin polyglutamylase complex subunit 1 isoform X2 [Apostichopus japonicus]
MNSGAYIVIHLAAQQIAMKEKQTKGGGWAQEDIKKSRLAESSQVNNWIKNALSQLVANRPDDPIAFLDQFFGNLGENTNKMNQALELISISHHSNHGFSQNATSAYEVLSQPKSARHPAGVLGGTYKTFLDHICSSMPVEIYLSISESLYKVLDSSNDNTVEKQVCEAVITELEEILNLSSHLDPTSYVNVGRKLQPDYLALALKMSAVNTIGLSDAKFITSTVDSTVTTGNMTQVLFTVVTAVSGDCYQRF